MTKQGSKRARREPPPRKNKRARMTNEFLRDYVEEQNKKINDHVNVCVRRINLLTEHVQFLQRKLLQQTQLYNKEFCTLHARCDESTIFDDFVAEFGGPTHEPADKSADASRYASMGGEEILMSQQELIDAVAHF